MASSPAFQLHNSISRNARAQLTQAVVFDEQHRRSEALAAYNSAATLLTTYIQSFSPAGPGFAKLSEVEQPVVASTRLSFTNHLRSVQARIRALSTAQAHHPRVSQTRQPVQPALQRASSATNDPLRQAIESEILDNSPKVSWDDIYGLDDAKRALQEMVVLPAQRPDLYTGLRAPGKGVLLFGPPGTGKTLIAKAVASNADATFFSISASSLNSKFHGESERLVRALFAVARERQPAFIFIDEVDSILGARSDTEHEASRRLKTEFMSQFDGAGGGEERVYVMAASNRPQDLDDAVRRRLDRRIYVGLPDAAGRREFFKKVTAKNEDVRWDLSEADFQELARRTDRFSGSDIKALCREASLMPLRELGPRVSDVSASEVRPCDMEDFEEALGIVRASADAKIIRDLENWNTKYGSKTRQPKGGDAGASRKEGVNKQTSATMGGKKQQSTSRATRSQASRQEGFTLFRTGGKPRK